MKKMILTLAIAFIAFTSFASDNNTVSQKVLDAFKTEFSSAKEVQWTTESDYYRATFNYNGRYVFAYYSADGEFLGLTRYLSVNELPVLLQNNLKKNYDGYWISDLFEASKNEGTSYYITLENADTKIVLRSTDNNTWTSFSKFKKS